MKGAAFSENSKQQRLTLDVDVCLVRSDRFDERFRFRAVISDSFKYGLFGFGF